jgi:GDP-L-fucose synthase
MNTDDTIFVAGSRGLVGGGIVRRLRASGFTNVLTPGRAEVDLSDRAATERFFAAERPRYVFLAAARVGGIMANSTYAGDFIRENLEIQLHTIDAARRHGAEKLLFLGSSCIYPKLCPQPIKEEYFLTGPLEPTNSAYAVAKIAGIEMIRAYRRQFGMRWISAMPTNVYGPGDNYNLETSHVLPALIRKFHEAKIAHAPTVTIWGTGSPLREFIHSDDLADACVFLMQSYDGEDFVNIGHGVDQSIAELARIVGAVVGYNGQIVFDTSKPDGTPRKLLDVSRLNALGWRARIGLEAGVASTYQSFLEGHVHARSA